MDDKRPRVILTKAVNLAQLKEELGGVDLVAVGDLMDPTAECHVVIAREGEATQAQLEQALAAHLAQPVPTVTDLIDALPNPADDFAGFKTGLAKLFGQ